MREAIEAQLRAAQPGESSWVSANAGSGKTRVLTDRVARLLLSGTDPAKILCLTYTKAAAAEMQTRLFRTLGAWAMLEDAALRQALRELGEPGGAIPAEDLARARTLFARALETPGGLKIQTIHAFCDSLLRRFPLEAGVTPQFTVLEDRQARALREEVLDALAEREPEAFAGMARYLSGDDPDPLLQEINRRRDAFVGPFERDRLADALGAPPGRTIAQVAAAALGPEGAALLAELLPAFAEGKTTDAKAAEAIAAALNTDDPAARLEQLESCLLFGKAAQTPFSAKCGRFPTKALRAAQSALMERLDDLMLRVEAARPQRIAIAALEKSAALHVFARAWLAAWDTRKQRRGLLDFDDMIARARRLLSRPETAAWVLWRLDGGLDHILVDEAQDTSPAQWAVIEAISAEFFAGLGARDITRTIFVVGDEKQSIYSFQGADPQAFGGMRTFFERMLGDMDAELQRCDLLYSFRSAAPVLELVDAVFRGPAGEGLEGAIAHHAIEPDRPGRVEVWPFLPKPDRMEEPAWDDPVDMLAPDDPVALLAERIAAAISGWLGSGRILPGTAPPRRVRAGDVLILVQRRGALFDAVIRALKRAGVPVAGADVLRVGAELAVKDLLAALRFAATPGDDLSLAAFLRSPLGGVSEAELFGLAHARKGSLWGALHAAEPEAWPEARAMLAELLAQADYLRPFELLQRILVRRDGRRKLTARLGAEAEDGIDALLDQALAYEQVEAPTLTGFLGWIDRGELTVKRRMDEGSDQVRVMTVHGAKGLEAPIVILPDTAERRESANAPEVLPVSDAGALWRVRAEEAPPAIGEAEATRRAMVRAENRRLLYVALTRARTWLIVCGAGTEAKSGEDWHGMVRGAIETIGPRTEDGTLVIDHAWSEETIAAEGTAGEPPAPPDWARRPAPAAEEAAPPLSPSALGGPHGLVAEGEADPEARARGDALHRLLEVLPQRPAAEWPRLAARVLGEGPEAAALLAEAAAVLEAPGVAWLFAGGLAEVEITAPLPGGPRILGRIDRVLAVDFKSHRAAPETAEATPEGILRQMGAYAAALAEIWPDRRVETAVLWTRGPRLMVLPAELTAAAFQRALRLDPVGAAP